MVLFIVLIAAIIIMIFGVGVLTQSMNEVNYAQQQIDQIVSDELAKGIFWNQYSSTGVVSNDMTVGYTSGYYQNEVGRNYQINMSPSDATTAAITNYSVVVNYDTFQ